MTRALIVSDSSPLNILTSIRQVDILPALFERVMVPPEVLTELRHPHAPEAVRRFVEVPPAWLVVQAPKLLLPLHRLDPGERAAISLAVELNTLLLIDERHGRDEATARGVSVIGAIGVLERAADARLVKDLAAVHQMIRETDFHVSERLLADSLERHRAKSR